MALAAGALALWAQTWAQAHLAATRAAIVMALEPVFAAFFAVTLGGESLDRSDVRRRRAGRRGDVPRRAAVDAARPHGLGGRRPTGRGAPPRRVTQR